MSEYKGIIIIAETASGRLEASSKELLGCGRQLADELGEELSAVIAGSGITDATQEAVSLGADKAYVADNPILKDYQADAYLPVIQKVVEQASPRCILLAQTSTGRDLAPRLAFRLGTAATLDCTKLEIDKDSKQLQMTKPVYGGNALATFTSESFPQIAAVRAKVYSPPQPDASRQGEIINVEAGTDTSAIRTKVIEKVSEEKEGIRLEDAPVVIGGGRGIGSVEGFSQLQELADLLKGAVGATRPPCDNGWVADSAQIGLTGRIISPELYIAVALSGASQHVSGFSGAKNIVAINKDAEAGIFSVSRFGIVGDWQKILPSFTAKVKELLSE